MKRAVEKLVGAILIFSLIITSACGLGKVEAKGKDSENNAYYLDDLRVLIGKARIYNEELEQTIINDAKKLELSDEQLTEIITLVGDIEGPSETEKARDTRAKELIAELNREMTLGYYPTVILATYEQAKLSVEAYESTFGTYLGSEEIRQNEVNVLGQKVEALKYSKNSNPEIGESLCVHMPIVEGCVTGTYETLDGATMFSAYDTAKDVKAMFNCTITDIKSGDAGKGYIITMKTGDALTVVYECDMNIKPSITEALSAGNTFSVKQGDSIGSFKDSFGTVKVTAVLDEMTVDVLRLLGETGATLKQQYIAVNPDIDNLESLWQAIKDGEMLSNLKPGAEGVERKQIEADNSSVEAYFSDDIDYSEEIEAPVIVQIG